MQQYLLLSIYAGFLCGAYFGFQAGLQPYGNANRARTIMMSGTIFALQSSLITYLLALLGYEYFISVVLLSYVYVVSLHQLYVEGV